MNRTNSNIQKLVTCAMLCAMAYTVMAVLKTPPLTEMPPLKYEPKDVIILLGGFLYGPLSVVAISTVVSLIEMVTVSGTGLWGCAANILSSCAFVLPASIIYLKRKTLGGAIVGLIIGIFTVTGVMALWNYLVVPIYQGIPREVVAGLLLPVFIPFNLFKSTLSAILTMLIFKPVTTALFKSGIIEPPITGTRSTKAKWVFVAVSAAVAVTVLFAWLNPFKPSPKKEEPPSEEEEVVVASESDDSIDTVGVSVE